MDPEHPLHCLYGTYIKSEQCYAESDCIKWTAGERIPPRSTNVCFYRVVQHVLLHHTRAHAKRGLCNVNAKDDTD